MKSKRNASGPKAISRKDFIRSAVWAAGAVLVLPGCGSDDDGGGSGGNAGSGGSGGSNGGSGGTGNAGSGGTGNGGAGGSTGGTGGAGGATGGSGGTGMTGCGATISANHGHVLMVSQADVDAAADKTYDIMGGAGHTHSVTITAADFATLAGGGSITVTSTTGAAHMHTITVMCA
ncbi:MAG: hypothetical protein H6718_15105 [Polyangiaceae bacterium]|nr:hypothetical protein [Polyangiaceae bacterium]MCB9606234.1 hypothetical protein [Polyangiaceae bacterium]